MNPNPNPYPNPLSEFPSYTKSNKQNISTYDSLADQIRILQEKKESRGLFSDKEPRRLGMFNQIDEADAYIKGLINRQKWTRERFTSEDLVRMLKTEFPNSSIHRIETPEDRVERILEEVNNYNRRREQLKSATGLDIGSERLTRGGYKKRHRKSRRTRSKSRKRRSHRRR